MQQEAGSRAEEPGYPRTLDRRLELPLPESAGTAGWRMLDTPPARLRLTARGARYSTRGYDVVYEDRAGHLKEMVVVRRRQGVRAWRFRLHHSGGQAPRLGEDGRVRYGHGVVLDAPVVLDARGRTVRQPTWRLRGTLLSLSLDDRHLRLPYVVDPTATFENAAAPEVAQPAQVLQPAPLQPADTVPPAMPSGLSDGLAFDLDYNSSNTSLSATWLAPSGTAASADIAGYEYCFSTSSAGSDCGSLAVVPWTPVAQTTATALGLQLSEQTTYFACSRSLDAAGNRSASACSDGSVVDSIAPTAPAYVNDGTGADIDLATTTSEGTSANWGSATDRSGIQRYDYCLSASRDGGDCSSGSLVTWTSSELATSMTLPAPSLPGMSFVCVRSADHALNVSVTACSDGLLVDDAPPAAPITVDDGPTIDTDLDATFSPTQLHATWSAVTDELPGSGVARYEYCFTTAPSGADCATSLAAIPWTDNGLGTSASPPGLDLVHLVAYHACVRAVDNAGHVGNATCSDGQVVNLMAVNLLSPANGASVPAGTALTWAAPWLAGNVHSYRIYLDGAVVGSLPASATSFTPDAGSGSPLCISNFDAATDVAGCLYGSSAHPAWSVGTHGSYNSGGNSIALEAWDADRATSGVTYTVDVPAAGANLRFEHHFDNHATLAADGSVSSAWDGGQLEVSTDGGSSWRSTCVVGARTRYGTGLKCDDEVVEEQGGYTAVLGGGAGNPLEYRQVFAGSSRGMVLTTMRLSKWAGTTIRIRFTQGQDGCYVGMPLAQSLYCPSGIKPSAWHVDDVTLAKPTLSRGTHSWNVVALDAAGSRYPSLQTWNFTLT